jgi:CRISPR-associated protein Cas6
VTTIDLSFPIVGDRVARDHGYALYGALARALPAIHGASWLGVHPLGGKPIDDGMVALGRHAELRLRLPTERIGELLSLVGAKLTVSGATFVVGAPRVYPLIPAASLDARLVALKLTRAPRRPNVDLKRETLDVDGFAERYRAEIKRQLASLEIAATFGLCGRHDITVAGKRVVGYSVRIGGLSAGASLLLQERGIGGRRRMGCGVFRPTRGA